MDRVFHCMSHLKNRVADFQAFYIHMYSISVGLQLMNKAPHGWCHCKFCQTMLVDYWNEQPVQWYDDWHLIDRNQESVAILIILVSQLLVGSSFKQNANHLLFPAS